MAANPQPGNPQAPDSQPQAHPWTSIVPIPLAPDPADLHPRLRLHRGFESRYLPDNRDVVVYLPPGYDLDPGRAYPVLYMHDGQNLFDPRTSFIPGKTWRMYEQADDAIGEGTVEPLIIVGIYNTGDRRLAEYTPERDWQMGGGEAANYGLLLTRELMPWIASLYRVRTEREATGLGGSSLGGLVTLYLGLRHAEYFGRLAVLSPSVWWNHKGILGYVNERAPGNSGERPRMWLDVGDREGRRTLENTPRLIRRLIANGWQRPRRHASLRAGCGRHAHDEASWAARACGQCWSFCSRENEAE